MGPTLAHDKKLNVGAFFARRGFLCTLVKDYTLELLGYVRPFPSLPLLLCEIEHPCHTGSAPMLSTRTAYAPGPPNDDAVLGWGHGGRVQEAMHCRETKTSIRIFTESGLLLL